MIALHLHEGARRSCKCQTIDSETTEYVEAPHRRRLIKVHNGRNRHTVYRSKLDDLYIRKESLTSDQKTDLWCQRQDLAPSPCRSTCTSWYIPQFTRYRSTNPRPDHIAFSIKQHTSRIVKSTISLSSSSNDRGDRLDITTIRS